MYGRMPSTYSTTAACGSPAIASRSASLMAMAAISSVRRRTARQPRHRRIVPRQRSPPPRAPRRAPGPRSSRSPRPHRRIRHHQTNGLSMCQTHQRRSLGQPSRPARLRSCSLRWRLRKRMLLGVISTSSSSSMNSTAYSSVSSIGGVILMASSLPLTRKLVSCF